METIGCASLSIIFAITLNLATPSPTAEKAILDTLTKNYDSNTRPTHNSRKPTVIKLGLKLSKVVKLSIKEQELHTNLQIIMRWTDVNLRWNKSKYNGTDQLIAPSGLFWTPDILLSNTAQEQSVSSSDVYKAKLQIDSNGTVTWMSPIALKSSCDINVKWFPFDSQKCSLIFGSLSMTTRKLKILFLNKPSSVTAFQGKFHYSSGIWKVQNVSAQLREEIYPCCNDPFSLIEFTIGLKRLPMYYILYLVLPCLSLSFMLPFIFFVPPDSGERIGFGITIVLSMSVYLLVVSNKLPEKSNESPLIGVLYVELFIIMIVALLAVIFTNRVASKVNKPPRKLCHIFCEMCTIKRREQTEIDVVRGNTDTESTTETGDGITDAGIYRQKGFACANPILYGGLTFMLPKAENEMKNQDQWKEIAGRIDQMSFCIFTLLTIGLPLVTTILYMN